MDTPCGSQDGPMTDLFDRQLPLPTVQRGGHQRGSDDERHLWPTFFRFIRERRPCKSLWRTGCRRCWT